MTIKDTLDGDNMYTCSQCGKKVRAEKRSVKSHRHVQMTNVLPRVVRPKAKRSQGEMNKKSYGGVGEVPKNIHARENCAKNEEFMHRE